LIVPPPAILSWINQNSPGSLVLAVSSFIQARGRHLKKVGLIGLAIISISTVAVSYKI